MFTAGSFSFILQNFYVQVLADNFMMQMLVHDVEAWWIEQGIATLAERFDLPQPPKPPTLQSWGTKVGFVFDPSGVLWHITETAR